MKAEIINPFVLAAMEILKMETNLKPVRGTLALADARWTTQEVTVMISVVGPVEGTFQLGLAEKTAEEMTSRMIGEQVAELNDLVLSAMGEMGNIIAGRALIRLEQLGYNSDISPPTILHGEPARISTLDRKKLQIPMDTEIGLIELSVCLRDTKKSKK